MEEKISIIVPVYNVEHYLRRCIDSLLEQTYRNIEILLIDDCSTDQSAVIANEYVEKYPDVCRYIRHQENAGLSAARNTGMQEASGEWLSFVDSDDWVTNDYISVMYETAQKDRADIVMCSVYYYYSPDNCKEVNPFGNLSTGDSHQAIVALSRSYACARLFRKELFISSHIIFPKDIRRGEDIATIIPLLTTTDKISLIARPMYYYFQRTTSLSNENKNIDISFYPKTVERMIKLSKPGFETELEFRAISELMYGMVMLMVRSGRTRQEVRQHVDWFNKEFSNWRRNPYLSHLAKGKRLFIYCANHRWYGLLKLMIWAWDKKQSFK